MEVRKLCVFGLVGLLFYATLGLATNPDLRIMIELEDIRPYTPKELKEEIQRINRSEKDPVKKLQLKARLYFIQRLSQVDESKRELLIYALRMVNPTEEIGASYNRDRAGYTRVDMNWKIVNRLPVAYYLVLAHEFEHAIQLEGTPIPNRFTWALRFLDQTLNPYPRQAIKTANKETEAFQGEWEVLQFFSKAELAEAGKQIDSSELSDFEKDLYTYSLKLAKEPKDTYVRRLQKKSHHTHFDHIFLEYIMKLGIIGLPVSCFYITRALAQ